MAKPNSLTTIIRRRLARIIDPLPPGEEAWCIDCTLNDGWTLVVPPAAVFIHLRMHKDRADDVYVNMIGRKIPAKQSEAT